MEKKMNYYEILQVKKNASQEEIRNSYINLIKNITQIYIKVIKVLLRKNLKK